MSRWLTIILLLAWVGIAGAQATPTATPTPTGPPMCSITGNVANPDGSPYVGVIKFDSSIVQIINNVPINPLQVSTATSPSGVINPISMPQGLFTKVTMCPNASSSSGCAATFTAIVPAQASANFGSMAMGTNLINPSIITSSLSVSGNAGISGNTTISGTLSVGGTTNLASTTITGPTSVSGNTTIGGPLGVTGTSSFGGTMTFPDGSTYDTGGHENMKALGIGEPVQTGYLLAATSNTNGAALIELTNPNAGANVQIAYTLATGTGGSVYPTSLYAFGPGWSGNPTFPASSAALETSEPNGLMIGTFTSPNSITFNMSGALIGRFVNNPPSISGLQLGGYAGPINSSSGVPAIMLANGYLSGTGWANVNISGAAYPNPATNQWIADGGFGSGGPLLQIGPGGVQAMALFYAGPTSAGATVAWNPVMAWGADAAEAVHLVNHQGYGVPTVSSGSLAAGSRDTFGWVVNVTGGQTTLTFAKPFNASYQSTCVLTDAGQPMLWYAASQSNTSVTFVCVVPWTGASCSTVGAEWVEYHCAGMAE